MPGSSNWVAPRMRNSTANMVLPHPGLPQTIVGRPLGSPPPVTSSNPGIPVADFASARPFADTPAPDTGLLRGSSTLLFLCKANETSGHAFFANSLDDVRLRFPTCYSKTFAPERESQEDSVFFL